MRGTPFVFSDFRKGINLQGAPYSLENGQGRGALNFHSTPQGSIKKRNGCITIAETPQVLTSLFGCNLSTDVMIGAGGAKLYSVSTSGVIKTLKTGLTENLTWEWVQAPASGGQGPIYGINGTNTPQYWDGTSESTQDWTASEGSIPNAKLITYHENRVYVAKGSTLYWSDITDPRNFESPKGGSTQFDPEDGQEITALGKVAGYLIVFKERKTFILFDSNTGAYRRISDDMGCIAPRSVVATEDGTFFYTADNQLAITNGQGVNVVNAPISPLMNLISGPSKTKACGVHKDEVVYFSFSQNGGNNDTIVEYNLEDQSWWIHTITYSSYTEEGNTSFGVEGDFGGEGVFGNVGNTTGGINQWVLLDPSNTSTIFGAGSNTTIPRVLNCFVPEKFVDVDGSPFQSYWQSQWHVYAYPHIRKRMREIRVDAKGTYQLLTNRSFSPELTKEEVKNWETASEGTIYAGEGEFGGSGIFGDEASIIEKRFYTPGVGRAWSLKFESEDNQDLEIYSYTTAVDYRKD